jgi:protein-S-isoprenylcysteine O-methyltransferase Ste14
MYLGLALLYLGLTGYLGNWWNIILFPLLLLIAYEFVIRREERYFKSRFGQEYDEYRNTVRRWL